MCSREVSKTAACHDEIKHTQVITWSSSFGKLAPHVDVCYQMITKLQNLARCTQGGCDGSCMEEQFWACCFPTPHPRGDPKTISFSHKVSLSHCLAVVPLYVSLKLKQWGYPIDWSPATVGLRAYYKCSIIHTDMVELICFNYRGLGPATFAILNL